MGIILISRPNQSEKVSDGVAELTSIHLTDFTVLTKYKVVTQFHGCYTYINSSF